MANDHRLQDKSGNGVNFSCGNKRFQTNIEKGETHGSSSTRGSVFKTPLIQHSYSLWLEHVKEINSGDEFYWLMWYDSKGMPTIPMSGIFNKKELSEMTKQLASFIP